MAKTKKQGAGQYPLRLPDGLRSRIEKSAKDRNVSINAEILGRLERSFEFEDRLGGPKVAELVETIGIVMRSTGEHTAFFLDGSKTYDQGEWLAVPYAFDQARRAANTILEYHKPKGPIVVPKISRDLMPTIARKTKTDSKDLTLISKMFKDYGEWQAHAVLRNRGQDDE